MHEEKGHPPAPPASTAPVTPGHDPLEVIMAKGELPAAKTEKTPAKPAPPDLAAAALAAAKLAQPESKPTAPQPGAGAMLAADVLAAPNASPRREWVWRALLVVNFAVLAAVLALPAKAPTSGAAAPPAEPPRAARNLGFAIKEQAFYLRALELAGAGKFDDAIAVLDGYLKANPHLVEVEQRLILHALAMFCVRVGRTDDARRYEAAMDQLRVGAQLPHDLLDLASKAEAEGRGADMRRYYARFLLQQEQIPPSLRARIAQAHLKLGDGYRLEAERGAERERERERAAEQAPDQKDAAPRGKPDAPKQEKGGHR
jgi:hypothetical protein